MATTQSKKFKKVRLFKVSKELNLSVDSILEYLEENGYADAVSGKGLNASIVEEEAYQALREEFAEDLAAAERLKELRQARLEATGRERDEAEEQEDVVTEAAAEAAAEAEAPDADVPEADVSEAEAPEVVAEEEGEEEAEPVVEAVAEPEEAPAADEMEADAPAEVEAAEEAEPPAEPEEPEAEPVETPDEVATEVEAAGSDTEEAEALGDAEEAPEEEEEAGPIVEAGTAEEDAGEDGEDEEEEEEGTLTADRYKLRGTKVIGKIDLATVEDSEPGRRRRKRKRKTKAASTDEGKVDIQDQEARESAKKRKRRRGPKVDEADVEQTLQETLRELEQGASRVRQRRRRQRREQHEMERERERQLEQAQEKVLRVTEFISTGELANLMNVPVTEVISTLFSAGMMVSINQRLDADTIQIVADEFGYDVEFITEFSVEDIELEEDDPADLQPRAPVVTVMGHVDHGKTSLLDYIRRANVVAGEAGGITQHIGAYHVELEDGRHLTFLDTPGHEAFTAMRARGAQATDIVILVVAADDAVMPQTIEAINHARAAGVPIVVAINKVDKPEANPQRVMQQLAEQGVLVEDYGGEVQMALVSAKTGQGVDDLLDKVLLQADLMELKANPNRNANGIVIESRLEKGRGTVATVLVQNGTLRVGDAFVAGIYSGRVRAMFDERDNRIEEVGPARPAQVIGFDGAPEVGDQLIVLDDEREARAIAQKRQQIHREQMLRQRRHITLDEIGRRLALGEFRELNLIIKADVGGSVEALSDALLKLSTEEVAVNIIHSGVGAITESDVMLASASDAVIIGFQVRPVAGAREAAEREEVEIRTYSVIYNAIEDVRDALEGLLSPEESEKTIGVVEVREIFKVPKVGTVAGCYVTEGRIHRNDRIRLVREGVVIYDGRISSLKRFKDDVREVQSGYECGLSIENYNDIKVGDVVEAYEIIETKRKLEV
ncbi:MAG: translation initiation factor IF-2 [Bacteroidetes bacterium]|nr:MAG: translation initiation factor IF-2 [Bacteroidota bacterium]